MPRRVAQTAALIAALEDHARPPLLMGVLNVTPDSFADGGRFLDPDAAVARGLEMAAQGADILDVGGESTRPGGAPVDRDEELRRVIPVIRELAARTDLPLSIDTRNAAVAAAAIEAGVAIVNDVTAFTHDPEMPALLGEERPLAIAMHMRGQPADMMTRTAYVSLIADCVSELWAHAGRALDAGLPVDHLLLDPGIGFAKDARQNVELLHRLDAFVALGRPVVVGVSRKSFLGRITGHKDPGDRLMATAAAVALAAARGARVLRVHDVCAMKDVVAVAHAIGHPETVATTAPAPCAEAGR
jgi:dihydropteroate synthase